MSLIKEELQTSKINLTERRIVTTDFNLDDLNEGEIIVEIESFAFTSNNVTYGVAGEMMGYWKFFPSKKDPENLLKLGITMVQLGEKDQGCEMMKGIKKQYPKASKSVLEKAQFERKKFKCA